MTKQRRHGTETSETRALLLDVTEQVMRDDGYAAVTSRRIATEAGVTPALVHYYFATLDDLFLAVLRRRAEQQLGRYERILSSPQPLQALWAVSTDPAGSALLRELMALANHRKAIRSELAAYAERFRAAQLVALDAHLDTAELQAAGVPPVAIVVLISALSQGIVSERVLGMHTGIDETVALVERFLARLDRAAAPAPSPSPPTSQPPARSQPPTPTPKGRRR